MVTIVRVFELLIVFFMILLFFIGLLGNISLIICTLRNTELRNKSGLLLVITAFAHIICLSSELVHAYTILFDLFIDRILCFQLMFLYLNAIQFQCVMALIMIFDLFLAISVPLWYKASKTTSYLICLTIPAVLYAVSFQVPTILTLKADRLPRCNTMIVIASPYLATFRFNSNAVVNISVVVSYLITALYFARKCKNCISMKPVMKRVGVTAALYASTWFVASIGANILNRSDIALDVKKCLQSSLVLFGMICYGQNFYICIWRSGKYRKIAYELFGFSSKPTRITSMMTNQRQYSHETTLRT